MRIFFSALRSVISPRSYADWNSITAAGRTSDKSPEVLILNRFTWFARCANSPRGGNSSQRAHTPKWGVASVFFGTPCGTRERRRPLHVEKVRIEELVLADFGEGCLPRFVAPRSMIPHFMIPPPMIIVRSLWPVLKPRADSFQQ